MELGFSQSAFFGELNFHFVLIYFVIMGCTLSLIMSGNNLMVLDLINR